MVLLAALLLLLSIVLRVQLQLLLEHQELEVLQPLLQQLQEQVL
jgi:hypothetical protein